MRTVVSSAGHVAGRMAGAAGGSWPPGLRGGHRPRQRAPAHERFRLSRRLVVRTRAARRTGAPVGLPRLAPSLPMKAHALTAHAHQVSGWL